MQGVGVRLFAASVVLIGLAVPAYAEEQGLVFLDAMTTPGRQFGIGYYFTERLSVRPSLGIGFSGQYGTTFNLGGDARFDLLPGHRVSPYLTAGFNYIRDAFLVTYDSHGVTSGEPSNVTRFGGGAGFRAPIKYGLSLMGEARLMNSEVRDTPGGYQTLHSGSHFEAAVGISYAWN